MLDPWLLLRIIKIATDRLSRDKIAYYIIVLYYRRTNFLNHTPSLILSFPLKDAFVGEIERKFDVLYENHNVMVQSIPLLF